MGQLDSAEASILEQFMQRHIDQYSDILEDSVHEQFVDHKIMSEPLIATTPIIEKMLNPRVLLQRVFRAISFAYNLDQVNHIHIALGSFGRQHRYISITLAFMAVFPPSLSL